MTFSAQAKRELCRFEPESVCCNLAELSGIISAAGAVIYRGHGQERLCIETENNAVIRRAYKLLKQVFEVSPELVTLRHTRLGGKNTYRLLLENQEADFVLQGCGIDMQRRTVPKEVTARKCCRMSFLRGVFLACGSVTDPEKEYHLEMVLSDERFAESVAKLMGKFELNAHLTERRKMTLVYLKGQTGITDFLSMLGAHSARFAMEDVLIRKELRNNANRAVNCDSANVQRALTAAEAQMESIQYLLKRCGKESLPPELQEAAALRLENPELSLEELGKLCDPPLGKSGIYHRLKKIQTIAGEMKSREKESQNGTDH